MEKDFICPVCQVGTANDLRYVPQLAVKGIFQIECEKCGFATERTSDKNISLSRHMGICTAISKGLDVLWAEHQQAIKNEAVNNTIESKEKTPC